MSRAMKDSEIPWIGEIPEKWDIYQTSTIFHEHKEKNIGLKNTNLLSLSYGSIKRKDINTNEGLLPQSFETYNVIKRGDIVFRLTDLQNDKRSLRTGLCLEDGIITSAYVTLRANKEVSSSYYHYLFHTYDVCKVFYGMGDGVRQGMNWDDVRKIVVFCPELEEQRRIAEFLDKKCGEIDETITLQEEFIEELKAYKQSVITEAVTRGLNPNVKFKDSGIDWIGKIPQGWEVCRLKNVVKKRNQKADDTTLQYIGLEHLVGFSEEMVETENVYDKEGSNMCFPDDVIFGKLRPYLGKVKVIHEQCCCSAEFLVLHGASVPAYVRYLMLSDWFIEIVNSSTYGAKMPRANADFILNMNVCLPSNIDQQRQISDHLDNKCTEIDRLIAIKQQKIEELEDYKKSVIYEYVTGKKEVN